MKIVLAGGSGYLGQLLASYYKSKSAEVVIFSRRTSFTQNGVKWVKWDGEQLGNWVGELETCDVLINLSGRTVNCRYNEKNKKEILDSRVLSTKVLQSALNSLASIPKVWLNLASATIYKHSLEKDMTDEGGELGTGFSVEVCKAWETAFFEDNMLSLRKVALRLAMVMGKSGGPLIPLISHAKMGLAGRHASGKQYVSWIGELDFLRAIDFIVSHPEIEGTINPD
jgi:uncharacterized protein